MTNWMFSSSLRTEAEDVQWSEAIFHARVILRQLNNWIDCFSEKSEQAVAAASLAITNWMFSSSLRTEAENVRGSEAIFLACQPSKQSIAR